MKTMRLIQVLLIILFSGNSMAQVLVKSEHSIAIGMSERNTFPKTCKSQCSFIAYLDVSNLYFKDNYDSGAYIAVLGNEPGTYVMFGVEANYHTKLPELVVIDNMQKTNEKRVVLGSAELKKWEGFEVFWDSEQIRIRNIRSVKKIGHNNTPYSSLEKSDLNYETELKFEPNLFGYLFMSVDVNLWIDVKTQNYNSEWSDKYVGN
jgi:hypothetical protein